MTSGGDGAGRPFWKAVGSGNDFIVLDARAAGAGPDPLETPDWIVAACAPHTGIGADGVVFVGPPVEAGTTLAIRYYNADGSRASFCGNASLCATQMAVALGLAPRHLAFGLTTDAGRLTVTAFDGSAAEIELAAARDLVTASADAPSAGERRIGFAVAGVPHLVVLVDDIAAVPIAKRGAELRAATATRPDGANVNFVAAPPVDAPAGTPWAIRTFERGVEGETLACGSGNVAAAALLAAWGLVAENAPVALCTRSGRVLTVRAAGEPGRVSLAGEGRIVYEGRLRAVR